MLDIFLVFYYKILIIILFLFRFFLSFKEKSKEEEKNENENEVEDLKMNSYCCSFMLEEILFVDGDIVL